VLVNETSGEEQPAKFYDERESLELAERNLETMSRNGELAPGRWGVRIVVDGDPG
jgi:hypothetical protein